MKCGMVYRRVTEVTEVDQPTIPGLPNYWTERPSFGRSGFNNEPPKMGPFLKRKRSMESWEELSLSEEVRSFKRVRVLSNIKKTRKAAFASWEDKSSWSVTESGRTGTVAGCDSSGSKSTPTAEVDAPFRTLLTETFFLPGATFFPRDEDNKSEEGSPASTLGSREATPSSEQRVSSAGESACGSQEGWEGSQAEEDNRDETRLAGLGQPRNTIDF